jgi:signal transduction histidine kinase
MNSLEKMRQELIENQESKNRFIMGISHDLRTPVAVIKGYSEAIMDNVITDKDEMKDSMELIEQKTTQLEGMIDTLINFMKLNNVEIKEKLVPHSITKLITDFAKYAEVT